MTLSALFLDLRIAKELRGHFSDLRILQGLGGLQWRVEGGKRDVGRISFLSFRSGEVPP